MNTLRLVPAILLATLCVLGPIGCTPDAPADPKITGPEDPKLKRIGREAESAKGGKPGTARGAVTESAPIGKN
jgi:hypothetical protein